MSWAFAVLRSRWDYYGEIMRAHGLRVIGPFTVSIMQRPKAEVYQWDRRVRQHVIWNAERYWRALGHALGC